MKIPSATLLFLWSASSTFAAITPVAEYRLGEAGSLGANNIPLDSVTTGSPSGAQDIDSSISGSSGVVVDSQGVIAPGSTHFLDTSSAVNSGWYGSSFSSLATDNFAFGVFARASSLVAANQGDIFSLGGSTGSFKLSLAGNGWAASSNNVAWIGTGNGVSGSFSPNTWVHLALVRKSGTTTFYINGVANGTYTGVPVHAAPHLSVSPGGGIYFDGMIDEARVVTFDPADSESDILNALTAGPVLVPDALVRTAITAYDLVSLGASKTSVYRVNTDVTTINKPDLFSVAAGHALKIESNASIGLGSYDLFKYNSAAPLNLANFTLQLPSRMDANLIQDSVSAPNHIIKLDITGTGSVKWNGNLSSVWDTGSAPDVGGAANWVSNGVSTNFIAGDTVIFDESATAYSVSINGTDVSPTSVLVDPIGVDYVFSGTNGIAGSTTLLKSSAGKVTFTNANSYTGVTTITGGILELGNGGALGNLGTAAIVNNATLQFNRSDDVEFSQSISGNGALVKLGTGKTTITSVQGATGATTVSFGTLALANASSSTSYIIASGATLECNVASLIRNMPAATFTGEGTIVKTGAGEIYWPAAATFSLNSGALIDVQQGIFTAANSANEVWTNNKADLNVAEGAIFDGVEATTVANGGIFLDALTGSGTIRVGFGAPGEYASKITFGVDSGSGVFNGLLTNSSAAGTYVKAGTGTQTLTGMNTYSGDTIIEAGVLSLAQSYLADSANVRIVTGAVLNLTHTAVDSINQLLLDGVAQPAGIYGSLSSAAPTKVAYLTGTGMLRVGQFGYPAWAATNAANQIASADADGDGVTNGVEYFMGQTGSNITLNPAPISGKVTWPRDSTAVATFVVQVSTDMVNWSAAAPASVDTTNPSQVVYTLPTNEPKHFVRLVVTPL